MQTTAPRPRTRILRSVTENSLKNRNADQALSKVCVSALEPPPAALSSKAAPGIGPRTSRTRSENHNTKPSNRKRNHANVPKLHPVDVRTVSDGSSAHQHSDDMLAEIRQSRSAKGEGCQISKSNRRSSELHSGTLPKTNAPFTRINTPVLESPHGVYIEREHCVALFRATEAKARSAKVNASGLTSEARSRRRLK